MDSSWRWKTYFLHFPSLFLPGTSMDTLHILHTYLAEIRAYLPTRFVCEGRNTTTRNILLEWKFSIFFFFKPCQGIFLPAGISAKAACNFSKSVVSVQKKRSQRWATVEGNSLYKNEHVIPVGCHMNWLCLLFFKENPSSTMLLLCKIPPIRRARVLYVFVLHRTMEKSIFASQESRRIWGFSSIFNLIFAGWKKKKKG